MITKLGKDFWIVWFATFFFFAGFYALIIPLPQYLEQIGLNDMHIGLILGALGVTSLIARPITGFLSDSWGRKMVILAGSGIFVLGVLLTIFTKQPLLLFIARSFQAIGYVSFTTSATTKISDIINSNNRAAAMAIFGAAANVAMTFIPLGINQLLKSMAIESSFLISASLVLTGAFIISFVSDTKSSIKKSNLNISPFNSIKKLGYPVITTICFGVGFGAFFQFVPMLSSRRELGTSGLVFLVFGIAIIVTRLLFNKLNSKLDRKFIVVFSIALLSLSLFLFLIAYTPFLLLTAASIIALASGILHPLLITIHFERVVQDKKGIASALFYFGFDIGIGMGAWILSPILLRFGISGLYLMATSVSLFGMLPAFLMLKKIRSIDKKQKNSVEGAMNYE